MIKNKLFRNAFIYTLTEVINKAMPFLLLPTLTIYLSPSDYGIVATYGAFIAILTVFIHISMSGAVSVNFFKLSKEHLKIYIANTLLIVLIATLFGFFVVLIFQDQLSVKLEIPFIWMTVGIFIVLGQFLTALNLVLWQVEERPKPFATYQIAQMLANTSMVLIFVVGFKMGWEGQLIGQAVATILFALISFGFIFRRGYLTFQINKEYIVDALKFGVPLVPHVLSGWLKTGVDRIFLTMFISTSATGLYAIGYQFGMIIGIVALAFNQAYSPYLYKKLSGVTEEEKQKIVKFTYLYFIGILLFAGLLSLIMPWFIVHFLDVKYLSSIEFIPWISFGFAFQGMYFMVVNYIFYVKKTYILATITFLSGLIHVLLSYMLIHSNGAVGAAQATVLSFLVTFIAVWVLSMKIYPMPWGLNLMKSKKGTIK